MTSEKEQMKFTSIANSFTQNLRALRVFNERVGAIAVEHDESAFKSFMGAFESMFPEDFFDNVDADIGLRSNETGGDNSWYPEIGEAKKAEAEKILREPQNLEGMYKAAISLKKAAPVQEHLLRTSVLISLMRYLEALIADLIHAFYIRYPEAMPAEERTLSLAELREIGSVEEAESFLVAKEVDSVLRESLDAQLRYFSKKFKIDLSLIEQYKLFVIEVDQRRNLFVHNRGIVNRTYLERVDNKLIEEYKATKGERLSVREEYLGQAMDKVEIVGVILMQQCWRKWDKSNMKSADSLLVDITFERLQEQRYEIVKEIAQYSAHAEMINDLSKRMVCVNQAIALRDLGQSDKVKNVLDSYDWSACGLNFQLALFAVQGREDEFYELLPRAAAAGEVKKENLETWPLFRNLRDTDKFKSVINSLFGGQPAVDISEK